MNQMLFNTPSHSRDLTDMDLSAHLGPVASRGAGGLNIQFFYTRVRTKSRNSQTSGRMETRLCVAKQPVGDRYTISMRYITEAQAAQQFPREFAHFKQYQDVPTSGTPLHEMPGASQSQIAMLAINGIRSIEDLAEISEDQINQLGFDAVAAHRLAKRWFKTATDSAETIRAAEVEAKAALERDTLLQRMAALEETNRRLQAQVDATLAMKGAPSVSSEPAHADTGEGLEYDISKMPDPYADCALVASGNDDLNEDIDPLQG